MTDRKVVTQLALRGRVRPVGGKTQSADAFGVIPGNPSAVKNGKRKIALSLCIAFVSSQAEPMGSFFLVLVNARPLGIAPSEVELCNDISRARNVALRELA